MMNLDLCAPSLPDDPPEQFSAGLCNDNWLLDICSEVTGHSVYLNRPEAQRLADELRRLIPLMKEE